MNNLSNNLLSESVRLQYLNAMDVTPWVLRKPFAEVVSEIEIVNEINLRADTADYVVKDKIENTPVLDVNQGDEQLQKKSDTQIETANKENVNLDRRELIIEKEPVKPKEQDKKTAYYLKLVKWESDILFQAQASVNGLHQNTNLKDKTLLIVCRHKVNQPANSFANQQSPSRFMQDYLKIIIELGLQNNLRLNIKLAHLAEAGIGQSTILLETYLEGDKPDLTLALGEESVINLLGISKGLIETRCRLNKFNSSINTNQNLIVSYHPFDLISNPRLKALAFEDIKFCLNTLILD